MEDMIENFAMEDQPANKTWTRIIVEKFLMHVSDLGRFFVDQSRCREGNNHSQTRSVFMVFPREKQEERPIIE